MDSTAPQTERAYPGEAVAILYRNWRGETAVRAVLPRVKEGQGSHLWFGRTEWHPLPQWLLHAEDLTTGNVRDFACEGVLAWGGAAVAAALNPMPAPGLEQIVAEAINKARYVEGGLPYQPLTVNHQDVAYCTRLAKGVLAALADHQNGAAGETFDTICAWAEETFGPITPERIVGRADEEMVELRADPGSVEEAADVVICLARHKGLGAAIDRKMGVNRKRQWRRVGDGTGYHIKAPATPAEA